MSIKQIITGLALSMLLASGVAIADWGDVYYCQMTAFGSITTEGEQQYHKLDKFQFKLDQTKKAMVFGSSGYVSDQVLELVEDWAWPEQEAWYAKNLDQTTWFEKGKFSYAQVATTKIVSMTADCDKF
jgi:hypothetical protein